MRNFNGTMIHTFTIFGIEYSYKELEHLKSREDFKNTAELIDSNQLPYLLSELFDNEFVTFFTNDLNLDEKGRIYYLCIELTNQRLYNNPNYDLYNLKIKKECDRLNIQYKIPDIQVVIVEA